MNSWLLIFHACLKSRSYAMKRWRRKEWWMCEWQAIFISSWIYSLMYFFFFGRQWSERPWHPPSLPRLLPHPPSPLPWMVRRPFILLISVYHILTWYGFTVCNQCTTLIWRCDLKLFKTWRVRGQCLEAVKQNLFRKHFPWSLFVTYTPISVLMALKRFLTLYLT